MIRSFVILCVTLLSFTACGNDDVAEENNEPLNEEVDCIGVVCTLNFVTLNTTVKDPNQNAVALDSYRVIRLDTNEDITITLSDEELQIAKDNGFYPLIADGTIDLNQQLEIRFIGTINGTDVISSDYTMGMDCCHVFLVDGSTDLVLN